MVSIPDATIAVRAQAQGEALRLNSGLGAVLQLGERRKLFEHSAN